MISAQFIAMCAALLQVQSNQFSTIQDTVMQMQGIVNMIHFTSGKTLSKHSLQSTMSQLL